MFAQITCPSCNTMGQFSLVDGCYKGPYRCWKCKALYTVEIDNAKLVSCQPMGENELETLKAQQEAKKKGAGQTAPPAPSQPAPAGQSSPSSLPKAPFAWPKIPENQPKPTTALKADPKALPKAPFVWPPIPKPPAPGESGKH